MEKIANLLTPMYLDQCETGSQVSKDINALLAQEYIF
jgi:hypothetical protein